MEWKVEVTRLSREFVAYRGTSESEARTIYAQFINAENVKEVRLYVNGNLDEIYQVGQ